MLELLEDINKKLALTIVIITHEMHVIRRLADSVAVMEAGKVIEEGPVAQVFTNPQQELTKRFVNAELDTSQTPDVQEISKELLQKYPDGLSVKLNFHGNQVGQPVVNRVIRKFPEIELSILEGSIHQVADKTATIGSLYIQLLGPKDQVAACLEFFKEVRVETVVINDEF